jgi:hypothetical protein
LVGAAPPILGGEHVGVQMVRDLRGVIEREEAEMGIMVTLANPTGPMESEAAGAGFVRKSAHGRLPRLQVVSVADILAGHMPKHGGVALTHQPAHFGRMSPDCDRVNICSAWRLLSF